MNKWIYSFGGGKAEGNAGMRDILGGKGSSLAEMSNLGILVPPGFTLGTGVCTYYYKNEHKYPDSLESGVHQALAKVEQYVGSQFGDPQNPLLVSVRSGARVSMPGMMDTVLNLGLNDQTVEGLATCMNDRRCAYDSYRRFIQMYADIVLGIDHNLFEEILSAYKQKKQFQLDTEMAAKDWEAIVVQFKQCVAEQTGKAFPEDVQVQLWEAISAVFSSWMNDRAVTYRKLQGISDSDGTAVNVQAMVFGNRGDHSATGVTFTRNPSTGQKEIYGEFLLNAQGEDVVAGVRTPWSLTAKANEAEPGQVPLETLMPDVFHALVNTCDRLEKHYRDMQDIEFTIQEGKLWVLQTRSGKRSVQASLKITTDMVQEGLIGRDEALLRLSPEGLGQLLHPTLDRSIEHTALVRGLPASPGGAVGEIVFDANRAKTLNEEGRDIILVRSETSPDDIHGMHAAVGILTLRGGMTSHAAVIARGMGRPCVSGVAAGGGVTLNHKEKRLSIADKVLCEGDFITIDGSTGEVFLGCIEMRSAELSEDFVTVIEWAKEFCSLKIRTNADTPKDAQVARSFGAEGIGLCRTEHMFFDPDRIPVIWKMILADTAEQRQEALEQLLPMQQADFTGLFEVMLGYPITIRLLDPPLHEFLPEGEQKIAEVAEQLGISVELLKTRIQALVEANPMLGHRGCRLAITYPEITRMQVRAIFQAAGAVIQKTEQIVEPEIMIPFIWGSEEFNLLSTYIREVEKEVELETGVRVPYRVGTMIELTRACLKAGEIAQIAEFFSFGTNDLTQTCMGLSRDDSAHFLSHYLEQGLLAEDPFISIDQEGVGELMRIAVERGRKTNPDLKIGICGEHGGDPKSIKFCNQIGLNYVSCSPFRVPSAQLAAAQAAILERRATAEALGAAVASS